MIMLPEKPIIYILPMLIQIDAIWLCGFKEVEFGTIFLRIKYHMMKLYIYSNVNTNHSCWTIAIHEERTITRGRILLVMYPLLLYWFALLPRYQDSWGPHKAHLGHVGPRWAPCWLHEPCYQASYCNGVFCPTPEVLNSHWLYCCYMSATHLFKQFRLFKWCVHAVMSTYELHLQNITILYFCRFIW